MDKELEESAEKWVFETNGHKWSNNDDTAGDNYGSYKEGFNKAMDLNKENAFTLSDLKEQLIQLNTAVTQLIAHSAQTAENSGAAVKATKDLSGNLYT